MKKSFTKHLSAFLALVLILSALPMAAFAAEVAEDEHTGVCCSDNNLAMPASALCEDGMHLFRVGTTKRYTNCGGVHRVDYVESYVCAVCGYSYTGAVTSSAYEAHAYTKTAVGVDPDTNLTIYLYACVCGNSYYGN